jgi:hypothetical protein
MVTFQVLVDSGNCEFMSRVGKYFYPCFHECFNSFGFAFLFSDRLLEVVTSDLFASVTSDYGTRVSFVFSSQRSQSLIISTMFC